MVEVMEAALIVAVALAVGEEQIYEPQQLI